MLKDETKDPARSAYRKSRINHWNTVANAPPISHPAMSKCYHDYLSKVYRFLIPVGSRVLEIGCGSGGLLADIFPAEGVGLDFSSEMLAVAQRNHAQFTFVNMDVHDIDANNLPEPLKRPFDIIILSDVVNDLWDVRDALERIRCLCKPQTRLLLNFHSHLWERPAEWVQKKGAMTKRLEQNWLTPNDMQNLLYLADFEVIRSFDGFIWPWKTPLLERLCNRWLAKLPPFRWLSLVHFMVCRLAPTKQNHCTVSVVIPARNEAGNIEDAVKRTPEMGMGTEIVFVEGNSTDQTWEAIQQVIVAHPDKNIRAFRQPGKGKGDAVRTGFDHAQGDVLMILDADLTVPPESLPQFYETLISSKAEFVNGVRLVYPQEKKAMRLANLLGNKFFGLAFSWLLDRSIKDTLCGTKVLDANHYRQIAANRSYFGDFDPFGDFDLIFGAAKLNLKIVDLPVRYRDRIYGDTNISRWRDGWILLRMTIFAARRIKFVP